MSAPVLSGPKNSVLGELVRRRDNAEALMQRAEAARDDAGFSRGYQAFWLRTLQIDYLERRSESDRCPRCLWGEEGWPLQGLLSYDDFSACLEHRTPELEERAARMAQEEAMYVG